MHLYVEIDVVCFTQKEETRPRFTIWSMFGLTGMMSDTVNADADLQVTSMTTSKYVRDYAMKSCSVSLTKCIVQNEFPTEARLANWEIWNYSIGNHTYQYGNVQWKGSSLCYILVSGKLIPYAFEAIFFQIDSTYECDCLWRLIGTRGPVNHCDQAAAPIDLPNNPV